MDTLINNIFWISLNMSLAIIPVILGFLLLVIHSKIFRIITGFFWLLFIPNTIYIVTDIYHLGEQWHQVEDSGKLFLILQFLILEFVGLISYILALHPMDKILRLQKNKLIRKNVLEIIILLNFLIALGVMLGRVGRVNSWQVITNTHLVYEKTIAIFQSPELLLYVILFGFFANITYFTLRRPFLSHFFNLIN